MGQCAAAGWGLAHMRLLEGALGILSGDQQLLSTLKLATEVFEPLKAANLEALQTEHLEGPQPW